MDKKSENIKKVASILLKTMRNELIHALLKELGRAPKDSSVEDFKWVRKSLSYRIVGDKIVLFSTWKLMRDYLDGKDIITLPSEKLAEMEEEPIKMEITIKVGNKNSLISALRDVGEEAEGEEGGEEESEESEESENDSWVHPKTRRDFITRSLKKTKKKIVSIYLKGLELKDLGG